MADDRDPSGTTGAAVGAAVRSQRLLRGVTLRELARRIEVSAGTLSAIENALTTLSVERLCRIAEALDVTPDTLLPDATRSGPAGAAPARAASPTVAVATGHWRDFAPLPIDGVLAGAIEAFVAVGYHGASMRSVAALASMSVPGVYHHYASKQDLLVRVLDLTMSDLTWRLDQAAAESDEPVRRVALLVEALALYHARRNDLAFIGASEMRSLEPASRRRIAQLRSRTQALLDLHVAAARAAVGVPDPHTGDAGKAIATMCTSLAQWFDPRGATTPEEIAREYSRLALAMLGLPPPAA